MGRGRVGRLWVCHYGCIRKHLYWSHPKGMLSPVVCKHNLMHVGGTAFLYILHTYGGGLFFIVFVDIWKINNAKFTSYPIH